MEKNTQPQRDAAARIQNPTVRAIVLQPPSGTDPSGSYTGKPLDETERPCRTQTICSTGRKPRAVQCAPPAVFLLSKETTISGWL